MSDTQESKNQADTPEVQDAIQAAVQKQRAEQMHLLSMGDVGRILGLSPSQVVRAKKEGKLPVKRLDVTTPEGLAKFAQEYLKNDRNGKPRVNRGQ